jgi:hypothetical protein
MQSSARITSCDLEPTSWESAPMKRHDTSFMLAWLVTVAIVTVRLAKFQFASAFA